MLHSLALDYALTACGLTLCRYCVPFPHSGGLRSKGPSALEKATANLQATMLAFKHGVVINHAGTEACAEPLLCVHT